MLSASFLLFFQAATISAVTARDITDIPRTVRDGRRYVGLPPGSTADSKPAWVEGEVIVKFKSAEREQVSYTALLADVQAIPARRLPAIRAEVWRFDAGETDVLTVVHRLEQDPGVEYAEPNYVIQLHRTPDDPRFDELWGMHNTGQASGTPGADISALNTWDRCTGSGVIVAVVDTGIDYTHVDLEDNMWMNPGETGLDGSGNDKRFNGIDDDGNGFTDDVFGIDAHNDDSDPMDDHYHGTHCAGTIGAVGNNGIGVAGVCWKAQIMALKAFDATGNGDVGSAVQCIDYAVQKGARVISCSFGFDDYSQALHDIIAVAGASNVLLCASAGNDNADLDTHPQYPGALTLQNILTIASSDSKDRRSSFSNYGSTSVDLAAPGSEILSTAPGNSYQYLNGTSMATPHCSGAATLLLTIDPTLSCLEVKQLIMDTVDPLSAFSGITVTGGRLNLYRASTNLFGIFFDDHAYFTGTRAGITVLTADSGAGATQSVSITSSDGDLETLLLTGDGLVAGVFTNSIWVDYGAAVPGNGMLEGIQDTIFTATYYDVSSGNSNVAIARVSLLLNLSITTTPGRVSYEVKQVSLAGICSGTVPVHMVISNEATGQAEVFVTTNSWISPSVTLTGGENRVWVYGTNIFGFYDHDSVMINQLGPAGITNYVSKTSANPLWPYETLATAAHDIQTALNASFDGNCVLVDDGVYQEEEIFVDIPVILKSMNGAENAIIDAGKQHRCMSVNEAAKVQGFTLQNGYDFSFGGGVALNAGELHDCIVTGNYAFFAGGGVYPMEDTLVNNCTFIDNEALLGGGMCGSYNAVISNSEFYANYAGVGGGGLLVEMDCTVAKCSIHNNDCSWNGGIFLRFGCRVNDSIIYDNTTADGGGGVHCYGGGEVNRCIISGNSANGAAARAGGVFFHEPGGVVNNSLIVNNTSAHTGGGMSSFEDGGIINNCTICDNSATTTGGGIFSDGDTELRNSILYFNSAANGSNYASSGSGMTYAYTCATPMPLGTGNISDGPAFTDRGNTKYTLLDHSPCIDAGNNSYAVGPYDLAGNPRIYDDTVDMGSYEFIPEPGSMLLLVLIGIGLFGVRKD
jgi:subtilisin family serine protease